MKRTIDDYHDLAPGTTKQIRDKYPDDDGDDDDVSFDLDNRTKRFDIGFLIYKVFDNKEYKRKIIGYDSQHQLYQVQYEDGDKEEFYHNEIHAHCNRTMSWRSISDKKSSSTTKSSSAKSSSITQAKKKKDIRPKYCTRR